MPLSLDDLRKQTGAYQDWSDDELADALHRKYYPDMDFADFSAQIGYKPQVGTLEAAARGAATGALDTASVLGLSMVAAPAVAGDFLREGDVNPRVQEYLRQIGSLERKAARARTPEIRERLLKRRAELVAERQQIGQRLLPTPSTTAQDWVFQNVIDPVVATREEQALDPIREDVGTGDQIAFGAGYLAEKIPEIMLGAAGGAGPVTQIAGASQAFAVPATGTRAREMAEAGVSPEVIANASIANYLANTAMGAIPVAAPGGLATRMATGAGLNTALGVGARTLEGEVLGEEGRLEHAGRPIAQDPLDPTAVTTEALLGAALGALFGGRAPPRMPETPPTPVSAPDAPRTAPSRAIAPAEAIRATMEAPPPVRAEPPAQPSIPGRQIERPVLHPELAAGQRRRRVETAGLEAAQEQQPREIFTRAIDRLVAEEAPPPLAAAKSRLPVPETGPPAVQTAVPAPEPIQPVVPRRAPLQETPAPEPIRAADTLEGGRVEQPRSAPRETSQPEPGPEFFSRPIDEQGSLELYGDPVTGRTPSGDVPAALRGTQGTLLGNRIARDYVRQRSTSLVGQTVEAAEDLATLAQVYRNPSYETLHYVLTRGDQVVMHSGVSSRLPASAVAWARAQGTPERSLQELMQRAGADGYYLLHNHPSGDPSPSHSDIQLTGKIANRVPGFRGHVVIDTGRFTEISMVDGALQQSMRDLPLETAEPYDITLPVQPHPLLGTRVTMPEDLALTFKRLENDADGQAVVIGRAARSAAIQGIMLYPKQGLFKTRPERLVAEMRAFARATGSADLFLTGLTGQEISANGPALNRALNADLFTDVVATDGASFRQLNPPDIGARQMGRVEHQGYSVPFEDVGAETRTPVGFAPRDLAPEATLARGAQEAVDRPGMGVEQRRAPYDTRRKRFSAEIPGFKRVARHLLPEDVEKLNRATAQRLVDVFRQLPSGREMASVAYAGRAKRGWYQDTAEALVDVFGPVDSKRFVALLASTSPRVTVEENLRIASGAWAHWVRGGRQSTPEAVTQALRAGRGGEAPLPAWVPNATEALARVDIESIVLSGPKADSFMRNLWGELEHVTNDAWIASYAAVPQTLFRGVRTPTGLDPGKGPGYQAMAARTREAAKELTRLTGEKWTPAEVQETVWSWAKALYELADSRGESRTIYELATQHQELDALIRAVPDFRTLLQQEVYRAPLEEAGYGPTIGRLGDPARVAELRGEPAGRSAEPGAEAQTGQAAHAAPESEIVRPGDIRRAAGRLDELRQQRRSRPADDLDDLEGLSVAEETGGYGANTPPARPRNPVTAVADAYRRRIGDPTWNAIERRLEPILHRARLTDRTPTPIKRAMRRMRAEQMAAARKAQQVTKALEPMSLDERKLISDYIEGELEAGVVPPEHVKQTAAAMQAAHAEQGRELVRLELLSEKSHKRLSGAGRYLARYYGKHLLKNRFDNQLRQVHKASIRGDRLKGRGLTETIAAEDWPRYKELGWELRDMSEAELADAGAKTNVDVWRDFTPEERRSMGEVRDAGYRYVRGYLEAAKDIAMGRMFERIAESEFSHDSRTAGPPPDDWVQVPETIIPKTGGAQRYGKLAGHHVSPDVWDHIKAIRPARPDTYGQQVLDAYLYGLSLWKEGMTALNPVVHGNNVISNVIMADWAGIPPWEMRWNGAYGRALREYIKKGPQYLEALKAGLFGTEFFGTEIRQIFEDLGPSMRSAEMAQSSLMRRVMDYAYRWSGAETYRNKMGRLYQAEDQFFKLLVYMDQRAKGAEIDEAIDTAERYFFNYADIPQGVRVAKATVLPFFSYTHKALPVIARTWVQEPWKMAKWIALFGGANWAAYEYAFGDDASVDEETERALIPKYMRGTTSIGTPKSIRLPVQSRSGNPMFMSTERRMPMGDLLDLVNQSGGVTWPAPFMPSHPLLNLFSGVMLDKDPFTGREVVRPTDRGQEAERRAGYIARQLLPNTPVLPGSYSWNKVMNGIAGSTGEELDLGPLGQYTGRDYYGREQNLPRALADTLTGFKVREIDMDEQRIRQHGDVNRLRSQIRGELRALSKKLGRGAITQDHFDNELERLMGIMDELGDEQAAIP